MPLVAIANLSANLESSFFTMLAVSSLPAQEQTESAPIRLWAWMRLVLTTRCIGLEIDPGKTGGRVRRSRTRTMWLMNRHLRAACGRSA